MNTLIILPVYNEAENLPGLLKRIIDIHDTGLKVLIIDDNSTDGSFPVSEYFAKDNPRKVFLIRRDGIRGRGSAVIEGYKFAVLNNFDYVIEMDADLSHPPEYIPLFLKENKDADLVIASRYVTGGRIEGRSCLRNIISYLANIYLRFSLNLRQIKDVTSGYRCIKVEFLKGLDLDSFESKGPQLLQEIIFNNKDRIRIKEIPVVFRGRFWGKSKFGLSVMLNSLWLPFLLKRKRSSGRNKLRLISDTT